MVFDNDDNFLKTADYFRDLLGPKMSEMLADQSQDGKCVLRICEQRMSSYTQTSLWALAIYRQISQGLCMVCASRKCSDQTVWMCRLLLAFAGGIHSNTTFSLKAAYLGIAFIQIGLHLCLNCFVQGLLSQISVHAFLLA